MTTCWMIVGSRGARRVLRYSRQNRWRCILWAGTVWRLAQEAGRNVEVCALHSAAGRKRATIQRPHSLCAGDTGFVDGATWHLLPGARLPCLSNFCSTFPFVCMALRSVIVIVLFFDDHKAAAGSSRSLLSKLPRRSSAMPPNRAPLAECTAVLNGGRLH